MVLLKPPVTSSTVLIAPPSVWKMSPIALKRSFASRASRPDACIFVSQSENSVVSRLKVGRSAVPMISDASTKLALRWSAEVAPASACPANLAATKLSASIPFSVFGTMIPRRRSAVEEPPSAFASANDAELRAM